MVSTGRYVGSSRFERDDGVSLKSSIHVLMVPYETESTGT